MGGGGGMGRVLMWLVLVRYRVYRVNRVRVWFLCKGGMEKKGMKKGRRKRSRGE